MQTGRRASNARSRSAARSTPIPQRASAHPEAIVRGRPRYPRTFEEAPGEDMAGQPTTPPPILWQQGEQGKREKHETPRNLAESDQSSLSLIDMEVAHLQNISRLPTAAELAPSTDDVDTLPSLKSLRLDDIQKHSATSYDLAEVDTVPAAAVKPASAAGRTTLDIADIPTIPPPGSTRPAGSSAREMPEPTKTGPQQAEPLQDAPGAAYAATIGFNPFDRLRWWLLYPGRLESLLWSGAMVLLVCTTVALTLVTALSLRMPRANQVVSLSSTNAMASAGGATLCSAFAAGKNETQKCVVATATSPDGQQIALFSPDAFAVSSTAYLQGRNFSPAARVTILHDANLPCQPATAQADQHGNFTVPLALGKGADWSPGNHELLVEDGSHGQRIMLAFVLSAR